MGVSSTAVVLVFMLLLGAVFLYGWLTYQPPPQQPASLSFSYSFPNSIPANSRVAVNVTVRNNGGGATSIVIQVSSNAFSGSSSQFDLGGGQSKKISVDVAASNVQSGRYYGTFQAQYTDVSGRQAVQPTQVSTYILQPVKVTSIGWLVDFFHPLGKSTIGTTDSTSLHFQVQSESSFPFSGLSVFISVNVTAPGMSFSPQLIQVGSLGPQGTSAQLSTTIATNQTPPGVYFIFVTLLSSDNFQLYSIAAVLTVTAQ